MTRFGWLLITYSLAIAGTGSVFLSSPPKLIWNTSASVPVGLYVVRSENWRKPKTIVAAQAPHVTAQWMSDRGYLPLGVPLLKHIEALPGQKVCRLDRIITIDGTVVGEALSRDRIGRPLPVWRGCQTIGAHQVFLMNTGARDSFDGRYFGLTDAARVIGKAVPVYTDPDGQGHYIWHAAQRKIIKTSTAARSLP
ncbi:S26 family signal peptidase [Asticcacaulis endophyticus]|uniref:Peptidase S26 n=1 Tax=Asticcacaulis endophyticus TaxID=1395890 RepID=A0A918UST5_9CAUL|nr:S26 family signal peptidase [Asticcacaulis endophyticus]GGZ32583.1 peptidase S26 [Asticcacaulis endophyticus]